MHGIVVACTIYFIIDAVSARTISNQYTIDRNYFLEEESSLFLGSDIKLNQDEVDANKVLMHWKKKEIDESLANPAHYNFSKHFFAYKNDVTTSKVYQMIKKMPKGAALHVHSSMMLDADSLLRLTYEDHLYACYGTGHLQLQFADNVPSLSCPFKWTLLSELRSASNDVTAFDSELRKHMTLYTEDQSLWDTDINTTWRRFNNVYAVIKSIIKYRPVREKYFYESLKNFYNDNVLYVEIRSGLHELYELDGSTHDGMYLVSLYKRITEEFIKEHPDFIGIKLILTQGRWKNEASLFKTLETARELQKETPQLFAGFDLVGQEDLGKPLIDYEPALLKAKQEVDFYFHGGETNWFGTATDENLIDAVLLGSKRIGHAYALLKHPMVLATVKHRNIALEVNVISNVVLSLVRDVRNHPLASYLALGMPVVLSSDDPGAWDADPLSHDFYVAFVGVASAHSDLRMLKQLAINSIQYSALDVNGKKELYDVWSRRWDMFVKELVANNDYDE